MPPGSPVNPDNRTLPPNWTEHYDSTRGKWFYVNNNENPSRKSFIHPMGPVIARPTASGQRSGLSFAQQLYASSGAQASSPMLPPPAPTALSSSGQTNVPVRSPPPPMSPQQADGRSVGGQLPSGAEYGYGASEGGYHSLGGSAAYLVPAQTPPFAPQARPSVQVEQLEIRRRTPVSPPPLHPRRQSRQYAAQQQIQQMYQSQTPQYAPQGQENAPYVLSYAPPPDVMQNQQASYSTPAYEAPSPAPAVGPQPPIVQNPPSTVDQQFRPPVEHAQPPYSPPALPPVTPIDPAANFSSDITSEPLPTALTTSPSTAAPSEPVTSPDLPRTESPSHWQGAQDADVDAALEALGRMGLEHGEGPGGLERRPTLPTYTLVGDNTVDLDDQGSIIHQGSNEPGNLTEEPPAFDFDSASPTVQVPNPSAVGEQGDSPSNPSGSQPPPLSNSAHVVAPDEVPSSSTTLPLTEVPLSPPAPTSPPPPPFSTSPPLSPPADGSENVTSANQPARREVVAPPIHPGRTTIIQPSTLYSHTRRTPSESAIVPSGPRRPSGARTSVGGPRMSIGNAQSMYPTNVAMANGASGIGRVPYTSSPVQGAGGSAFPALPPRGMASHRQSLTTQPEVSPMPTASPPMNANVAPMYTTIAAQATNTNPLPQPTGSTPSPTPPTLPQRRSYPPPRSVEARVGAGYSQSPEQAGGHISQSPISGTSATLGVTPMLTTLASPPSGGLSSIPSMTMPNATVNVMPSGGPPPPLPNRRSQSSGPVSPPAIGERVGSSYPSNPNTGPGGFMQPSQHPPQQYSPAPTGPGPAMTGSLSTGPPGPAPFGMPNSLPPGIGSQPQTFAQSPAFQTLSQPQMQTPGPQAVPAMETRGFAPSGNGEQQSQDRGLFSSGSGGGSNTVRNAMLGGLAGLAGAAVLNTVVNGDPTASVFGNLDIGSGIGDLVSGMFSGGDSGGAGADFGGGAADFGGGGGDFGGGADFGGGDYSGGDSGGFTTDPNTFAVDPSSYGGFDPSSFDTSNVNSGFDYNQFYSNDGSGGYDPSQAYQDQLNQQMQQTQSQQQPDYKHELEQIQNMAHKLQQHQMQEQIKINQQAAQSQQQQMEAQLKIYQQAAQMEQHQAQAQMEFFQKIQQQQMQAQQQAMQTLLAGQSGSGAGTNPFGGVFAGGGPGQGVNAGQNGAGEGAQTFTSGNTGSGSGSASSYFQQGSQSQSHQQQHSPTQQSGGHASSYYQQGGQQHPQAATGGSANSFSQQPSGSQQPPPNHGNGNASSFYQPESQQNPHQQYPSHSNQSSSPHSQQHQTGPSSYSPSQQHLHHQAHHGSTSPGSFGVPTHNQPAAGFSMPGTAPSQQHPQHTANPASGPNSFGQATASHPHQIPHQGQAAPGSFSPAYSQPSSHQPSQQYQQQQQQQHTGTPSAGPSPNGQVPLSHPNQAGASHPGVGPSTFGQPLLNDMPPHPHQIPNHGQHGVWHQHQAHHTQAAASLLHQQHLPHQTQHAYQTHQARPSQQANAAGGSSVLANAAKQQLGKLAVTGAVRLGGMLLGGALGTGAAAGAGTNLFGN